MRLALISDVHGNDVAFEAVAAEVARLACERVVCLGDLVQGGPQPAEVLARRAALDAECVLGNADALLLQVPESSPEPVTEAHLAVREWTLSRLAPADLEAIRAFPPTLELDLHGTRALLFHGSPRSYDDVLLPDSREEALEPYRGTGADLLAGGHTHTQWTRVVDGSLFVNPGSVGVAYDRHQPEDDFKLTPVAEYAIVTAGAAGAAVEFRRVPYSLERLREVIRASGRPRAAEYSAMWRG